MEKLIYVKPETTVIIVTDNAPLLSGSSKSEDDLEYDIILHPEKDPQVADSWKWIWQDTSEAD